MIKPTPFFTFVVFYFLILSHSSFATPHFDDTLRTVQAARAAASVLDSSYCEKCARETVIPSINLSRHTPPQELKKSLKTQPKKANPTRLANWNALTANDCAYSLFEEMGDKGGPTRDFVMRTYSAVKSSSTSTSPPLRPQPTSQKKLRAACAPPGYEVAEILNDEMPTSHADPRHGTFAVLFLPTPPNPQKKPPIFAIKGTASLKDWAEDANASAEQYLARLVEAQTSRGENYFHYLNTTIRQKYGSLLITGHSQGGALAEATAYLLESKNESKNPTHCVTYNALGGRKTLEQFFQNDPMNEWSGGNRVNPIVIDAISYRNFFAKEDVVVKIGNHLGGVTQIPTPEAPANAPYIRFGSVPGIAQFQGHRMSTLGKLMRSDTLLEIDVLEGQMDDLQGRLDRREISVADQKQSLQKLSSRVSILKQFLAVHPL